MTRQKSVNETTDELDDGALFRAAIGEVTLIPGQNRVAPTLAPLPARVRRIETCDTITDRLSDFSVVEPPDEFVRNGLSRQTLRKLKRGTYPIEEELDLHGYQSDEARKLLQVFLNEAAQRNLRCLRVIHGKGMNSRSGEAVLRKLTRIWLTQHPQVLAFCAASPVLGGDGAVLLLLKRGTAE